MNVMNSQHGFGRPLASLKSVIGQNGKVVFVQKVIGVPKTSSVFSQNVFFIQKFGIATFFPRPDKDVVVILRRLNVGM